MTTTARVIVNSALRTVQALSRGETLSAEDADEGLQALNFMLAAWSIAPLLVPYRTREDFALTSASTYTIGVGGDFDTAQPIDIDGAFYREGDNTDYWLTRMDSDEWDADRHKAGAYRADRYLFEPGLTLGTLYFDGVPNTGARLHLTMLRPLTEVATLDTDVELPPYAMEAVRYQLALRLAPEYDIDPSPVVVGIAERALADLQTHTARFRVPLAVTDAALRRSRRRGNWDYETPPR